jgi:hypothetical protein
MWAGHSVLKKPPGHTADPTAHATFSPDLWSGSIPDKKMAKCWTFSLLSWLGGVGTQSFRTRAGVRKLPLAVQPVKIMR